MTECHGPRRPFLLDQVGHLSGVWAGPCLARVGLLAHSSHLPLCLCSGCIHLEYFPGGFGLQALLQDSRECASPRRPRLLWACLLPSHGLSPLAVTYMLSCDPSYTPLPCCLTPCVDLGLPLSLQCLAHCGCWLSQEGVAVRRQVTMPGLSVNQHTFPVPLLGASSAPTAGRGAAARGTYPPAQSHWGGPVRSPSHTCFPTAPGYSQGSSPLPTCRERGPCLCCSLIC